MVKCYEIPILFILLGHNYILIEFLFIYTKSSFRCPDITRLYTLSETSVNGVPLYVLEFTDHPGKHEISKYSDQFAIIQSILKTFYNLHICRDMESIFVFNSGTRDEVHCEHARK